MWLISMAHGPPRYGEHNVNGRGWGYPPLLPIDGGYGNGLHGHGLRMLAGRSDLDALAGIEVLE
jgi:hypothetical protein